MVAQDAQAGPANESAPSIRTGRVDSDGIAPLVPRALEILPQFARPNIMRR